MKFFNKNLINSEKGNYRSDIDGLRAIAVLAVIGFHIFPEWVKGGFVGVDIFFVISGYLITGIIVDGLEKENFSFLNFYSRRIKRIFPALFLVLAFCLTLGWFLFLPNEYRQLGKHIAGGGAFISNFILWMEAGYFDTASELKPLLHLWSLGIEEQFYIFWPLLLFIVWKIRVGLFAVTLLVTVISFVLNIYGAYTHKVANFYLPITRIWELLIGACLAHLSRIKSEQVQSGQVRSGQVRSGQVRYWYNINSHINWGI